jgi:hypothetical protein
MIIEADPDDLGDGAGGGKIFRRPVPTPPVPTPVVFREEARRGRRGRRPGVLKFRRGGPVFFEAADFFRSGLFFLGQSAFWLGKCFSTPGR